jgi:hypothetical protein
LSKNLAIIEAAAADLGQLRLEDALAVLVVMAEKRDPRFDWAAARFAARVIIERRLSPADGHRVLALAQGLRQAPETTLILLRDLCDGAAPSTRGSGAADAAPRSRS